MKHVVIAAVVVATSACTSSPRDTGVPDAGPCVVDDDPDRSGATEQALVYIPPAAMELFLDEDSGGPLRCRPTAAPCDALEECVGAPVQLPIGVDATLAVGLRTVTEGYAGTIIAVNLDAGVDPAFTLLEPLPFQMPLGPGSETFAFVGVRPTVAGLITARLFVSVEASNAPSDGSAIPITLQVEGVAAR